MKPTHNINRNVSPMHGVHPQISAGKINELLHKRYTCSTYAQYKHDLDGFVKNVMLPMLDNSRHLWETRGAYYMSAWLKYGQIVNPWIRAAVDPPFNTKSFHICQNIRRDVCPALKRGLQKACTPTPFVSGNALQSSFEGLPVDGKPYDRPKQGDPSIIHSTMKGLTP